MSAIQNFHNERLELQKVGGSRHIELLSNPIGVAIGREGMVQTGGKWERGECGPG